MSDAAPARLTHLDEAGRARMVDVSAKDVTVRTATASGRVLLSAQAVAALRDGTVPKGDALAVARIAGITGAKRTPDLIPLCHPLAIHGVSVDLTVEDSGVAITASVRTADRTGVEMEALTSVSVAALTLDRHDQGGRQGRGDHRRPAGSEGRRQVGHLAAVMIRALAITVSNRASAGVYEDRSGPVLVELLRSAGCDVVDGPMVIPDGEAVEQVLRDSVTAGYDVAVTTGGTGPDPHRPDAGDDPPGDRP